VLLKNMSKTNPVTLNGVNVTEDGMSLSDGDEAGRCTLTPPDP
jgi:hypothetical protein